MKIVLQCSSPIIAFQLIQAVDTLTSKGPSQTVAYCLRPQRLLPRRSPATGPMPSRTTDERLLTYFGGCMRKAMWKRCS